MSRDLPTVVIADLDSTLCRTEHRWALADEALMSGNWDAYSMQCIDDEPIVGSITTLRLLYPYHRIHICSGRSIVAMENTKLWFEHLKFKPDEIKMYDRKEWESKPSNGAIKTTYIKELRTRGYNVVLFLEDWPETATAIEELGVPVLCINPRYKEPLTNHL